MGMHPKKLWRRSMPVYPSNVCSFYLKTIVLSGRVDFYDLQSPWGHVYILILFHLRKTIDGASGPPKWLKVTKTWVKSTIFLSTKEWCYKFLKMNSVKVSFCLRETRNWSQSLLIFDQNTQFLSSKNKSDNFTTARFISRRCETDGMRGLSGTIKGGD